MENGSWERHFSLHVQKQKAYILPKLSHCHKTSNNCLFWKYSRKVLSIYLSRARKKYFQLDNAVNSSCFRWISDYLLFIWRNSLCLRMRCILHCFTWRKPRRLLHLKKFLMLSHAPYFTSSYLEKTEKTPPLEEFLSVKMSRIKKFYLCQKGSFVLFRLHRWKSQR